MARTAPKNQFDAPPPWQEVREYLHAARDGDIATVSEFLDKYEAFVDASPKGEGGWTALMFAGHRARKDIVLLLLEKGADIDKKNDHNQTVLDYVRFAPTKKEVEIAKLLEQWPEVRRQREAERRAAEELAADIADFSPALKHDIPATRPINSPRKSKKGPTV